MSHIRLAFSAIFYHVVSPSMVIFKILLEMSIPRHHDPIYLIENKKKHCKTNEKQPAEAGAALRLALRWAYPYRAS